MGKRPEWVTLAIVALPIGIVLAVGLIIYASSKRECSGCESESVMVVVANRDIPPGTRLDPLIEAGDAFRVVKIPNDAMVADAIRSIEELRGQKTAALIYQNEQIPIGRLKGIL